MRLNIDNFSSFLLENRDFFIENKAKTLTILEGLVNKTNKIDITQFKDIFSKFYDVVFIEADEKEFEIFLEISKLNNINIILNRLFLFMSNNYIKYIFKDSDSIEKLLKFVKLCDFYILYLNHSIKNNLNMELKIPKEIDTYYKEAKSIIYLTVFKGIPISYKTYIKEVDMEAEEIQIKVNSHQVISAKFQKQVYLVNPDTGKTFIASVKKIIQNDKIVILHNITDIKRDNIKRNFIRVQPKDSVIANIKYKNNTFHGEIYDLSLRGLAVMLNPVNISISSMTTIQININYIEKLKITANAELISITKINKNQYKYHFYFQLDSKEEIMLEKYICYREKEIINELNQYIKNSIF